MSDHRLRQHRISSSLRADAAAAAASAQCATVSLIERQVECRDKHAALEQQPELCAWRAPAMPSPTNQRFTQQLLRTYRGHRSRSNHLAVGTIGVVSGSPSPGDAALRARGGAGRSVFHTFDALLAGASRAALVRDVSANSCSTTKPGNRLGGAIPLRDLSPPGLLALGGVERDRFRRRGHRFCRGWAR
jgi:hypothetical protein